MKYERYTAKKDIENLIEFHNYHQTQVALDIETTGLDVFKDKIEAIIITGYDTDSATMFSPEYAYLLRELSPKLLILQNFKFDFHMLYRAGIDLSDRNFRDTMLLHHLLDENKSHGLDSMVKEYFNDNYKEVFWNEFKDYKDAPESRQLEYACKDVIYTYSLYNRIYSDLIRSGIPESLISHVHSLAKALYRTELRGIQIDMDYLIRIGSELKGRTENYKLQMRELTEFACQAVEMDLYNKELQKRKTDKGKAKVEIPSFNFDSHTQLVSLLYNKLDLPVVLNKDKRPTVDDGALEQLKSAHPVIEMLREYRGDQKIYTAFIEGTLERVQDGRIHPSFNVNGTVTGRISSSNPNMQQLPRSGNIRGMYIPDRGHSLITCDYSQLEICLAAHFSKDPVLIDLVKSGESMHDYTAKELNIDRQVAKMVNFLVIYGGSEFKLSKSLNIPIQRAKRLLDRLWEVYKGLKASIDECHAKVDSGEPIVNPFGRRRRFPKEFGGHWEKERAKRQAFNSLVQGTGADLTHFAFHNVSDTMLREGVGHALFPVHDEIVIMPKQDSWKQARQILIDHMIEAGKHIQLLVPLRVDASEALERWEK